MLQLATNDSKVVPLVESSTVKVIGLTMANDGTALKPSILYDEHQKVNVGLKDTASFDFVRKNSNPDPDFLRQNVVTDADITYISTIDNNISLPVAVTYKPKSGKTGEDIKSQFLYEVCIVQTCLRCLQQATSMRHILHKDSVSNCNSSCSECTEQGKLCDACKNENHLSHIPSIRACNRCIENGVQCKRGAVLVITADCEQGNKTAFELLISDREAGILESKYIFAVLPDAVHVGKSLKASFANWPILLDTQRSCLPLVHTVRDAHAELKRILPRDSVTHKDRMDINCILHLTKSSVLTFLESVHGIVHTIIPDKYKISASNKVGLYPHPIAITAANLGTLYVIDHNPKTSSSRLLEIRQHVPAEVKIVGEYSDARSLAYIEGTVYICEHNKTISVYPKNTGKLNMKNLKKKANLLKKLENEISQQMEQLQI